MLLSMTGTLLCCCISSTILKTASLSTSPTELAVGRKLGVTGPPTDPLDDFSVGDQGVQQHTRRRGRFVSKGLKCVFLRFSSCQRAA